MKKSTYKSKHSAKKSSKINLLTVTRIICAIQLLVLVGSLTYVSFLHLLPIKYLIILALLIVLVTVWHILLIEIKTKKKALKIISIVLSVVVASVTMFGNVLIGTVHNSFIDLPESTNEGIEAEKTDVTKKPFLVYLSGMDNTSSANAIAEKGLSDVNMVVAVHPKAKKILMVNIPRDYYLPLEGNANKMDKLTHAGNYGVACSMDTLENLFDIEFNYYVKVNFNSVVDIVDALGGVTVNSEIAFSSIGSLSGKSYSFKVGENKLTGDAALAFARERSSLAGGDRQRGIHQQKIISAIFDKAISPSLLNPAKVKDLLTAITKNMKTNISSEEISKLVQMQLNDMSRWNIQSISVDGKGASRSCYAAGGQVLSVMIPDLETVNAAKTQIDAVFSAQ